MVEETKCLAWFVVYLREAPCKPRHPTLSLTLPITKPKWQITLRTNNFVLTAQPNLFGLAIQINLSWTYSQIKLVGP